MFLLLLVSIVVSDCNWKPGRCYTGGSATESPLWGPGNQADCADACAKYGQDHGAEVCCKFGWLSHPSEKRTCYVHLKSYRTYDEQSFNDRDNRVCMTGSKDSPGGLGYEKIGQGTICNAGYYLTEQKKATKNQCAAHCETTGSCNTFCWSDSSPEADCLMYTSCKSIGHFNSGSSTSSYGCYKKPHTPTCYEECMERYDDGFQDNYIGGNSYTQKECRESCNMAPQKAAMKTKSSYDDKCGCRYAYCESQLLDTASCCEYYRENSECDGVAKHECAATCVGLKFEGGNRKGQDVCSTTICGDPLNWVNVDDGGCTREPAKSHACCDQKTCEFVAPQKAAMKTMSSPPKLHTVDQEYHLKESNTDAVMDKEERWVRNERKEKSEDAVGYHAETAVVATAEGKGANFVLYGFAAIGLGFLLYGAGKHYTKESTEIYSEA